MDASQSHFKLVDCQEMNRKHPESFEVPPEEEIGKLKPGDLVYVIFEDEERRGERMWVEIESLDMERKQISGILGDKPLVATQLSQGMRVECEFRHVADFMYKEEAARAKAEFEKTGVLPGAFDKDKAFEVMETVIRLSEKPGSLFTLNPQDKQMYGEVKEEVLADYAAHETEVERAVMALISLSKMYLYVVVFLTLPAIMHERQIEETENIPTKEYLEELLALLRGPVQDVYWQIADNYLPVFEEFEKEFGTGLTKGKPMNELPDYYANWIGDALDMVKSWGDKVGFEYEKPVFYERSQPLE